MVVNPSRTPMTTYNVSPIRLSFSNFLPLPVAENYKSQIMTFQLSES